MCTLGWMPCVVRFWSHRHSSGFSLFRSSRCRCIKGGTQCFSLIFGFAPAPEAARDTCRPLLRTNQQCEVFDLFDPFDPFDVTLRSGEAWVWDCPAVQQQETRRCLESFGRDRGIEGWDSMCKCQVAELSCMKEVCANWAAKILKKHPLWMWCRKNSAPIMNIFTVDYWWLINDYDLMKCRLVRGLRNGRELLVRNSARYTVKAEGWGSWELGSMSCKAEVSREQRKHIVCRFLTSSKVIVFLRFFFLVFQCAHFWVELFEASVQEKWKLFKCKHQTTSPDIPNATSIFPRYSTERSNAFTSNVNIHALVVGIPQMT